MADYEQAYGRMIENEGGYRLVNVANDRGGQTYAGIARNYWPDWPGWKAIDRGQIPRTDLVRRFYRDNFWMPIRGDEIEYQGTAETIFDFAVNAGVKTAAKLAQLIVDAEPDGVIGPVTLGKLNQVIPADFKARYALAKIARYAEIVKRDRSQSRFLLGWINRTLREAA